MMYRIKKYIFSKIEGEYNFRLDLLLYAISIIIAFVGIYFNNSNIRRLAFLIAITSVVIDVFWDVIISFEIKKKNEED